MNRSAGCRCAFYRSSVLCFVAVTVLSSRAGRGNPFSFLPQCFVQFVQSYISGESKLVSGVTGRMLPNAALKSQEVGVAVIELKPTGEASRVLQVSCGGP
jgi:hypothetical protein